MLTLNDGRSELWQWDTGRKLTVDADCSQVHFSNKVFGRSVDVDVVGGIADIPDTMLQTDKELTAWAFVGTAENGYTKISKVFKVNKRNKPADYVFTEPDQTTLGEILNRIEDLENRPSADISKEDIQDAVNEYLDNNPVSVNEKDPTVPEWAKQPDPPKVEIPGTLPNPNKLTFSGAVSAEYDGSKAVEVVIPQGGESDGWDLISDVTVEEEVSNIEIGEDRNGKPFNLKAVFLCVFGKGTINSGYDVICTCSSNPSYQTTEHNFGLASNGLTTDGVNSSVYIEHINGLAWNTFMKIGNSSAVSSMKTFCSYDTHIYNSFNSWAAKPDGDIRKIKIHPFGGNVAIGARVSVYGKRA